MNILITAGPTREHLDPVRFLSNASTGKMGYACAAAAVERQHDVTLISGPVDLPRPLGLKLIKVVSAADMAEAVFDHFDDTDAVIMTAAVCDYTPADKRVTKIEKSRDPLTVEFKRTVDILAELGARKQHQTLIGFALQDLDPREKAREKMTRKNLDAVVLNNPAALGADQAYFDILLPDGACENFPYVEKTTLAQRLIELTESLHA